MGNIDTRCKHEHGYLMVQTAKPFYYSGEQVTGTVYLRALAPIDVSTIDLEVKGGEKASFTERVHRDNEWHDEKRKTSKTLLHFHHPCFTFAVSTLVPGDYAIPFCFTLPQGIASSLFYKNKHHNAKPKAKVKYHIKATLKGHSNKIHMKHKQVVVIREPGEYA